MKERPPRPLHKEFSWHDKTNRAMRRKYSYRVASEAWQKVHRLIKSICPGHMRRKAIRFTIGTR